MAAGSLSEQLWVAMMFEAYYRKSRLFGLALVGCLFIIGGAWMGLRPAGAFDGSRKVEGLAALLGISNDVAGHGVGWACALMGVVVLPILARQMMFTGPAICIDGDGIYWHRWSTKPIGWGNIAAIRPFSIYRNKMIGLMLRDPSLDRSRGLLGRMAGLNAMTGFGHVSLSAQGTDRSFDELYDAVCHHAALHDQASSQAAEREFHVASAPRRFGRRQPIVGDHRLP